MNVSTEFFVKRNASSKSSKLTGDAAQNTNFHHDHSAILELYQHRPMAGEQQVDGSLVNKDVALAAELLDTSKTIEGSYEVSRSELGYTARYDEPTVIQTSDYGNMGGSGNVGVNRDAAAGLNNGYSEMTETYAQGVGQSQYQMGMSSAGMPEGDSTLGSGQGWASAALLLGGTGLAVAQNSSVAAATVNTPQPTDTRPWVLPILQVNVPNIEPKNLNTAAVTGTAQYVDAGTTVTVVVSDLVNHTSTSTATVNADGTYTVKPNLTGMTDGHLHVTASVLDFTGGHTSNTGVGDLELVADVVTVVGGNYHEYPPSGATAVPFGGSTSDIPVGATVTIVLSNSDAASDPNNALSNPTVTVYAVVQDDHTYSTTANLLGLDNIYNFYVTAYASQLTGDVVKGSYHAHNPIVDPIPPSISVVTPASISTPTQASEVPVMGSVTSVPSGAVVSVVLTDHDHHSVSVSTTVSADGTYSANCNISGLADGAVYTTATVQSDFGFEVMRQIQVNWI